MGSPPVRNNTRLVAVRTHVKRSSREGVNSCKANSTRNVLARSTVKPRGASMIEFFEGDTEKAEGIYLSITWYGKGTGCPTSSRPSPKYVKISRLGRNKAIAFTKQLLLPTAQRVYLMYAPSER